MESWQSKKNLLSFFKTNISKVKKILSVNRNSLGKKFISTSLHKKALRPVIIQNISYDYKKTTRIVKHKNTTPSNLPLQPYIGSIAFFKMPLM